MSIVWLFKMFNTKNTENDIEEGLVSVACYCKFLQFVIENIQSGKIKIL